MLIDRARAIQEHIQGWSQHRIDDVVSAVGWRVFKTRTARRLSELAVSETGLGSVDDTYQRHRQRILGVLSDLREATTVGVIETIPQRGLRKLAKPVGVVAVVTPATAPVAAIVVNALIALKTRNVVIFCPNPRAKKTAWMTVNTLRAALHATDAEEDIFQCLREPSREQVTEVMSAADLVVASGSQGTVKRAYTSGRPAYGAGSGNSVVVIDETADIETAAAKIVAGKSFDYGTSCSSESCLVGAAPIYDALMGRLESHGAYLCSPEESKRLRALAWPDNRSLSRQIVGQSAERIARLAAIAVPAGTRVLMVAGETEATHDPISREKLSPILGVWRYDKGFGQAVGLVKQIIAISGAGHSCAIFSQCRDHIDRLGDAVNVSRMMVNQSTCFGNTGSFDNGMPFSVMLSCGTWGGSTITENVNWRHFLNYTWISEPVARDKPEPSALFGRHWAPNEE